MTFPSKRSVINLNYPFDRCMLIDMLRAGRVGPAGSFTVGNPAFNKDVVDPVTLLPNHASVKLENISLGLIDFPDSDDFAGPYVLTWDGSAEWQFGTGTYTVNAGASSGYSEVSNGRWTGTDARIVFNYTGNGGLITGANVLEVDLSNTGDYPTYYHLYRLEDETDFLAGKLFRTPHLQHYVDLNPGALRAMNWGQTNSSNEIRWRNRNRPNQQCFGGRNFIDCDTYGDLGGTNTYTIANSTGSPVAMEHGEVVQARVVNSMVRAGAKTITGITKANPGVVTSTAHGFSNGDVIVFRISTGMTELNYMPCTVANQTANTFELSGVDTTAFTTFTAGTVMQYITLNRGGLGAYPIVFNDGVNPASTYSNAYIAAGDYKFLVFNKHHKASSTVDGVWIFNDLGSSLYPMGVAYEVITKFMVELNALQVAQGLGPTDLWVNIPHMGLCSMDADYDVDDHFGIQMVDTILNGNGSWPALPTRCDLMIEFSNETWNTAGADFTQANALVRLGQLRFGGGTDYGTYHSIRAIVNATDINAAFPVERAAGRIRHIQAGQGTLGVTGLNATRINGSANFDADALIIALGGGDPIDYFDAFAFGMYFESGSTYNAGAFVGLAADYAAATTDAEREAICQTFVTDAFITPTGNETISEYRNVLLVEYADAMQAKGKLAIGYEGGWNDTVTSGTDEAKAFRIATKQSRAWAKAIQYFHRGWISQSGEPNVATNAYYPATPYIMQDIRWGDTPLRGSHTTPDTYLNGVEGANLNKCWVQLGKNNRGIYSFEGSA